MKIGIYVGSFDPVHEGHKSIVNHLIDNNYLDKVIVIPTENYWNKQLVVDLGFRKDMLKLVFSNKASVLSEFSKYEFTYQIMEKLKDIYLDDSLYLIIGADNVKDFYEWKNVEGILKNYVLVIPRDGIDVDKYLSDFDNKDKFIIVKDFKSKVISSSFIRENIKDKNFDSLKNVVDDKVLDYIIKNNLYL